MFYLAEMAALLICWLFYCEFYWMIERKVLKNCSRQYLEKRCRNISDRLFFTPVSGKAHLGNLYYLNKLFVFFLSILTLTHLLFGWAEMTHGIIRILTTSAIIILGIPAAINSVRSAEYLCVNINVTSKKKILIFQIISLVSVIISMIAYLYFAWVYLY